MPGLVRQWREYRYQAYQMSSKIEKQRKLAVEFILDGNILYYESLKASYCQKEWPAVYSQIISLLEERGTNRQGTYASILVAEGEKQKLLEYVESDPAQVVAFIKSYYPGLKMRCSGCLSSILKRWRLTPVIGEVINRYAR